MEYEVKNYKLLIVQKTNKEGKMYNAVVLQIGSVQKVICFLNTDQYNFIVSSSK